MFHTDKADGLIHLLSLNVSCYGSHWIELRVCNPHGPFWQWKGPELPEVPLCTKYGARISITGRYAPPAMRRGRVRGL